MRRSQLKKVGKRVLQISLLVLVVVMVLNYVRGNWDKLATYQFQLNLWLLALSFLGFLLQELSYGLIWRAVLLRLGSRLDLRVSLRIYLASEFVRYIPGNVWHVLTRILWVSKYGVARPVAFASMTVELITKLTAGALVFALSLLFWSDATTLFRGTPVLVGLGVCLIVGLLAMLYPPILTGLLNSALRLVKKEPVRLSLRYRDILLVTLAWCVSWCVAGCAFYVLLLAIFPAVPLSALPVCIGIYALAWDIGFISFLTPSGLGFRESAVGLLFVLSLPTVPTTVVVIIAALSRIVSTVAELVCVSIAYASGGSQIPEVQQEHISSSVGETEAEAKTLAATDGEAPVTMQGVYDQ
ncbi:MAG: flippase-like domain-containing protein [Chloroflexi bacterium]|nr:MAG: flippase-like domain-containing protein [Chloroflexota bacterium]